MRELFRRVLLKSTGVHVAVILLAVVLPFLVHTCRRPKPRQTVTFVDLQTAPPQSPTVQPVQDMKIPEPPKDIPEPPKVQKKKTIEKSTKRVRRPETTPAPATLTPEEIKKLLESQIKSTTTTTRPDDDFPFSWYLALVRQRMYEAWQQPTDLSGAVGLKTQVTLRVRRDGTVEARELIGSSGNRVMDESVMRAVESVERLKELPPQFRGDFKDIAIEFELTTAG